MARHYRGILGRDIVTNSGSCSTGDPVQPIKGITADLVVSVIVPTRDRPAHALACVRTILAASGLAELIVVDQSDGVETGEGLAAIHDSRLRYVRTETRGVTSGRNLGMELSRGDIIALTDDDCRVASDWVRRLVSVFASDAAAAVVCGGVLVPDELQYLGWAESFHPRRREWQGQFPPLGEWGITANMAMRRSVLARVGAFDPVLGAGAPLRSGSEPDFLFRVLRDGLKVVNAEEVQVHHLGIRKAGDESTRLIRGYGVGTGAAFSKHVRLGDAEAARVYLGFLGTTTSRVCRNLLSRGRPIGAGFLLALLYGLVASFKYRIDREQRQYIRA
jgi:glycosyltransferase involved in cell wall biosynthesis